jgi:Concanavalin A-like lectin/glucanases superfamily/Immunoglobulin I-set domain
MKPIALAMCILIVTVLPCFSDCCPSNCLPPYPLSYTVTALPGFNYFADNLCQGTNNTLADILPDVPNKSVVEIWTGASFEAVEFAAGAWAANITLSPGEGFVFKNPASTNITLTISGCQPECPPPCAPSTGISNLVGSIGIGSAAWTNLFSCPPPCGAQIAIYTGSVPTVYNFLNGAWSPSVPVLPLGASAFVTVASNANCCTNPGITVTCPPPKTEPCGSTNWNFDSPIASSQCCSNAMIIPSVPVTNTGCPTYITQYWTITDACGDTTNCSQTVTVIDTNAPILTNPTNLTVPCGTAWNFATPAAMDPCGGTIVVIPQTPVTNGVCPEVITESWIASNICNGLTTTATQQVTVVSCVPPPPGMLDWWPADDTPLDIVGGNNGVINGAVTYAPGMVGQAFDFSGSGGWVQSAGVGPSQEAGTVDLWFYVTNWNLPSAFNGTWLWANTEQLPGGNTDGMNLGTHPQYTNTGELMFGIYDTNPNDPTPGWNWAYSGVTPQPYTWYHVAGTWGPGGIQIYVNGQLKGSNPYTGASPSYTHYNLIGRSSWPQTQITGLIDEVEVFDRALSAGEIDSIYAVGPAGKCKTPKLLCSTNKTVPCGSNWTFDPPTVLDACCPSNQTPVQFGADVLSNGSPSTDTRTWLYVDCCGYSNFCSQTVTITPCVPPASCLVSWWPGDSNALDIVGPNSGTFVGNAAYAPGVVGPAFSFDGQVGDYVSVPTSASLNITGPLTIEAWIQPQSVVLTPGSDTCIIWKGDLGGTDVTSPYALAVGLNNRVDGLIANGVAQNLISSTTLLQVGVWYHVAFVADGSNTKVYINGALDASAPQTLTPVGSPYPVVIGGGLSTSVNSFNGLVDELSLYNCALTSNQIAAIYAAGAAGKCKAPKLLCSTNKTVLCGSGWTFDPPTVMDCCTNQAFTQFGPDVISNGCPTTDTRTWLYIDCSGNSNFCSQLVTIIDTNAPVLNGVPAGGNLGCNPANLPTDLSVQAQLSVTNSCSVTNILVSHVDGGTPCAMTRTFTITATNACGYSVLTNVAYAWTIDTTIPLFTHVPAGGNLGCNPATLPSDASVKSAVTATDSCGPPAINVAHMDSGSPCGMRRVFTITAVNACGHSAWTNVAYAWTNDTTEPVINCNPGSEVVPLNANCQLVIPLFHPHATDNCTPSSLLHYSQLPLAGTIVQGPTATVVVTVTDLCGNSSTCTNTVIGQDKSGPVIKYTNLVIVTNCLVPSLTNLVSVTDACCPQSSLNITQSPLAGAPVGPGLDSVTINVVDCNGRTASLSIPLAVEGVGSFLNRLFNTGVNGSGAALLPGSVDPHYTLGPVPVGTPTGPGKYNSPQAITHIYNVWTLPPPPGVSAWIAPAINSDHYPAGTYVYTNQFILPVDTVVASASISGRWAADGGAGMYFNGLSTPANSIPTPNGFTKWSKFTITSGFVPNPSVNTIYFIVTNVSAPAGGAYTGLRVEYTNASDCSTCAPASLLSITSPHSIPNGGAAVLSVAAAGTPPFYYQWYFNNVMLQDVSPYTGSQTADLFIIPYTYADAGVYKVVVSNACGSFTASVKVTASVGFDYPSGSWNVANLEQPLAATVGPDLVLEGTNADTLAYAITSGTTEDFGLPTLGGQMVNVMHVAPLTPDTSIQIPLIAPPGSNTLNSYSMIMDMLQPGSAAGTTNILFESSVCCIGPNAQDGVEVTLDAQNILHLTGSAAGTPFDAPAAEPLPTDTWNRLALVVDDPQDGVGAFVSLYLNGQCVAAITVPTPTGLPINWNNSPPAILSRQTNDTILNGEFYLSSVQFHSIALDPETIAGMGSPDDGPPPTTATTISGSPLLAASLVNGIVNLSWTGSSYALQETTDLTSGDWVDSDLPFTETQDNNGNILTTAVADPTAEGPVKFYRLVFQP